MGHSLLKNGKEWGAIVLIIKNMEGLQYYQIPQQLLGSIFFNYDKKSTTETVILYLRLVNKTTLINAIYVSTTAT